MALEGRGAYGIVTGGVGGEAGDPSVDVHGTEGGEVFGGGLFTGQVRHSDSLRAGWCFMITRLITSR